jgi:hypothetical protein
MLRGVSNLVDPSLQSLQTFLASVWFVEVPDPRQVDELSTVPKWIRFGPRAYRLNPAYPATAEELVQELLHYLLKAETPVVEVASTTNLPKGPGNIFGSNLEAVAADQLVRDQRRIRVREILTCFYGKPDTLRPILELAPRVEELLELKDWDARPVLDLKETDDWTFLANFASESLFEEMLEEQNFTERWPTVNLVDHFDSIRLYLKVGEEVSFHFKSDFCNIETELASATAAPGDQAHRNLFAVLRLPLLRRLLDYECLEVREYEPRREMMDRLQNFFATSSTWACGREMQVQFILSSSKLPGLPGSPAPLTFQNVFRAEATADKAKSKTDNRSPEIRGERIEFLNKYEYHYGNLLAYLEKAYRAQGGGKTDRELTLSEKIAFKKLLMDEIMYIVVFALRIGWQNAPISSPDESEKVRHLRITLDRLGKERQKYISLDARAQDRFVLFRIMRKRRLDAIVFQVEQLQSAIRLYAKEDLSEAQEKQTSEDQTILGQAVKVLDYLQKALSAEKDEQQDKMADIYSRMTLQKSVQELDRYNRSVRHEAHQQYVDFLLEKGALVALLGEKLPKLVTLQAANAFHIPTDVPFEDKKRQVQNGLWNLLSETFLKRWLTAHEVEIPPAKLDDTAADRRSTLFYLYAHALLNPPV